MSVLNLKPRVLVFTIGVFLFVSASLWAGGQGDSKQESGDVFVSQEAFKSLLGKAGVRVVDVRAEADYKKGHIPGAVNLPFNVLQVPERDGLRSKYADDRDLEKAFSRAGLSYEDTLVLYAETAVSGGKQYVIFHYSGFPNLKVLDGGIGAWKGDIDVGVVSPAVTDFKLSRKQDNFIVGKDYVAKKIGDGQAQIIDGRNYQAYEDGHIPTSTSIVPNDFLRADKTLRSNEEILQILAAGGVDKNKEIISYCGSGGAASNNYLVLKQLGFKNVVLYEDSWDDWSRDTKNVQELSTPNYTLASEKYNTPQSLGPRFLSQEELRSALDQKSVLVVDVRSAADFASGRIPGSVNAYWNDTIDANRNLKSVEELQAYFSKKGISPDKNIVLFTRGGVQLSHAFTVFKLLGYPSVSAYTGRWDGWEIPSWKALSSVR